MFVDVVGYTSLSQHDEATTLARLKSLKEVLRPIFASHSGREVKTMGDAFLVEFPSALDAALCAVAIQNVMHDRRLARNDPLALRIGIHVGDIVGIDGDILGDAVNIASRIEPLSEEEGVCVSRQVYDQVHNKLPYRLTSLGLQDLKNVTTPTEVFKVELPWSESAPMPKKEQRGNRVAILPFANLSPDPQDEYFADGMTEELISAISKIEGIEVISRTSVMQYKKSIKPVREVSKELDVGTVLEGSVRRAGGRVRITVQAIDALRDRHLWSESYDRDLQDIFAIQSDIAKQVAGALQVKLLSEDIKRLEKAPTSNVDAYAFYLKGRFHDQLATEDDGRMAIASYERAIALDPGLALAYCGLADAYTSWAGDFIPVEEAIEKAKAYASKAVELDPTLAEAWSALGNIAFQFEWDWGKAENSFKRAIELNPSCAIAYNWWGFMSSLLGRDEVGVRYTSRAVELDPLSTILISGKCGAMALANMKDGVLKEIELLKRLRPTDYSLHNFLALFYFEIGMVAEAKREMDIVRFEIKTRRAQGIHGWTTGVISWIYSENSLVYPASGDPQGAREMLAEVEEYAKTGYAGPNDIGAICLAAGEKEKAYRWFERGIEMRDPGLIFHSAWRGFDSVRSEERFKLLLRKMGVPETAIAARSR